MPSSTAPLTNSTASSGLSKAYASPCPSVAPRSATTIIFVPTPGRAAWAVRFAVPARLPASRASACSSPAWPSPASAVAAAAACSCSSPTSGSPLPKSLGTLQHPLSRRWRKCLALYTWTQLGHFCDKGATLARLFQSHAANPPAVWGTALGVITGCPAPVTLCYEWQVSSV